MAGSCRPLSPRQRGGIPLHPRQDLAPGRTTPSLRHRMRWSSNHDLGHAVIDRQHRRIAAASAALAQARGGDPRAVATGLTGLIALLRRHFALEERLMERTRYPRAAGHRELHRALLADMLALRTGVRTGAQRFDRAARLRILDWLLHHTSEADRSLVAHLARSRRAGLPDGPPS
jgi:hemerythrin-like metal-binding protein